MFATGPPKSETSTPQSPKRSQMALVQAALKWDLQLLGSTNKPRPTKAPTRNYVTEPRIAMHNGRSVLVLRPEQRLRCATGDVAVSAIVWVSPFDRSSLALAMWSRNRQKVIDAPMGYLLGSSGDLASRQIWALWSLLWLVMGVARTRSTDHPSTSK